MYKLTHGWPQRLSDNSFVNPDTNVEYLAWLAEGNTPEPADPPPAPDYSAMRRAAYTTESDPLFFKEQRQEVPAGTWLDKVAEIKARFTVN
jgi:hypothetical protein